MRARFSIKELLLVLTFIAVAIAVGMWSYQSGYRAGVKSVPSPPYRDAIGLQNNPGRDSLSGMVGSIRNYEETIASFENELRFLAWNIESGGSDPAVIADQLKARQVRQNYHVIGLSEVGKMDLDTYVDVLGTDFKAIDGRNRYDDHLQLIYDKTALELIRTHELDSYDGIEMNNGHHRSPLFAHFKTRKSGVEFQVVLVHLARGKAEFREQQADGLREWARNKTLPTFAIGGFNFDYDFHEKTDNEGFKAFMRDSVWSWVEPELIDTNWADRNGDGVDDYPDSMLDFAFVAGAAKDWTSQSKVIVRASDFPDDKTTSDHRPIELIAKPPAEFSERQTHQAKIRELDELVYSDRLKNGYAEILQPIAPVIARLIRRLKELPQFNDESTKPLFEKAILEMENVLQDKMVETNEREVIGEIVGDIGVIVDLSHEADLEIAELIIDL